ncbi:MAG: wax ester/triacylglycerol synthase domain-containing protein [Dermatophilaceae bacterium]
MQQLSGMDGMFLSVDTPTSTGVMGGLIIYQAPSDPSAGSLQRMRLRIEERLDAIPPFRWVLTGVPLAINNAYWTEVDDVDVAAHLHEITLAAPGSNRQLAAQVASIMQKGLDKDRPLWDYTVIQGLEGGRLAHLLRIHHGVVDGAAVPRVLDLLSDHPTVQADPRDTRAHNVDRIGGRVGAAARGVLGTATMPVRLLNLQARTAKYLFDRRKQDGLILALPAFLGRDGAREGQCTGQRARQRPAAQGRPQGGAAADPGHQDTQEPVQRQDHRQPLLRLRRPSAGGLQEGRQGVRWDPQRRRRRRVCRCPAQVHARHRRDADRAADRVRPSHAQHR